MHELKAIKVKKSSVILDADKFEELKETIEILSDNALVRSISKALLEPKEKRKSHKEVFNTK